ncbi:MAG TPA: adenylate/guanylate cyclase domain-containing protein [Solirubrobacterales bacterium]|jgi:adenylate cyclase|nr:adenylate/guanylate cyclase domain-containing protein [Solirubrobacterales bacterium]
MTCAACGTENPERARFCMSCGEALAPKCPACGAENPVGAKFCIDCGSSLTAEATPPATAEQAEALPEERRKATVLFADLSGYTSVAERTDPERLKSIVDRALRRLGDEVARYGGTVDKYIGDNVMAVFGAPVAHEDDPERAVRAGLAMQSAMDEVNERIAAEVEAGFLLRVGINSGEVLAGRVGDGYTVIGDPVNVAARLQAAARPGSVTVGEVTHRLTRQVIEYEQLEPLELKGKAEPVAAWEAVRVVVAGRGGRAARPATPLIGREEESELLLSVYERVVREGRPHLVTVIGQAGVGKSRLLRELTTRVADAPSKPAIRLGSCPAYGAGLAYWALGEVIRGQFEIVDTDTSETAFSKLRRGIESLVSEAETEEPPARVAAIVGRPLGIEPPDAESFSFEGEDPQQTRDRLFSAVRSLVEGASRHQPLLLAVEDIHWADEGMLDLIEYLARWVRGPAMLLCMARDELLDRRPGWGGGRLNATTINLDPLPPERTRELVQALLPARNGGRSPNGQLAEQVAQRSGGNPLFAEEIINRIREEGASGTEALPETVHSVLAARLDSLPRPERRVLQHASVVGHTFWEGSLTALESRERIDLASALAALQEKDLIVPSPGSRLAGEREYAFKHVLIRDVAYSTLPKAVRAGRHAEVGAFIEGRAADRSEGVVAMVAEHYGRAAALAESADLEPAELERIGSRALDALESAGDSSAALYSNQEALGHYETALSLRGQLDPASRARIAEKLGDVGLRLGHVDQAVEAWERCMEYHRGQEDLARVGDLHRKIGAGLWHKGDREGSIEHYQRGIDLLKDGPPCLELVRLYEEAASLYMHTGDNMLAIYASEKALRLAERLGEAAAASRAHGIFGRVFGRIGDSERARENLERSVELARETDPGEAVRALLALGYHLEVSEAAYEGAGAAYGEALELAQETGDLPSQVELYAALAQLALHRGDWEAVSSKTEAAATLAEREGLQGKLCFPYSMRGVLLRRDNDLEASAEQLEGAFELAEQVGRSEVAFQALFWLAGTHAERGDHATADQALARALDVCERAGLVAQSLEATAARAVNLALWGKTDNARDYAEEAEALADRLGYPVGLAASVEARGVTAADPDERARLLDEARDAWAKLGRPLDAERAAELGAKI